MRIGIVCYPTFGGSGVIATELGKSLGQRGHEVHFICYNVPVRLSSPASNTHFHLVEVVSYPLFQFPPYTLALASKIAEVIERYKLDLIHVHYAVPHSVSAHLAQQMVGNKTIKIITTLHGTDIQLVGLEPSYFRVIKYAIENNNGITAVSDYLARTTHEEFRTRCDIRVIPNFVDTARFKREANPHLRNRFAAPGEKIVTHISNFRNLKRVPDVVLIFQEIRRQLPAKLLLVGEGPEFTRVLEVINQLGLYDQVILLHLQDRVEDILAISDLFLLPSEIESFGLAALEAMAAEVPVVATDVGGLPEVVEHDGCGYLAPVGDIRLMGDYAVKILQDESLARKFGARGREIAQERFSEENIVAQYERYYEEILAGF